MESDHNIEIYMRDIGPLEMLTAEDERMLAARIRRGDKAARERMIRSNLRLVVKIAHEYAAYGLPLLDLVSEGNIGLMTAVDRFDPKKGGKLSTYAAWWIRHYIRRALSNKSKTIRLPTHLVEKLSRAHKATVELTRELGRTPTTAEIAEHVGVSTRVMEQWRFFSQPTVSLDAEIDDDSRRTKIETLADLSTRTPLDEMEDAQMKEEVLQLIEKRLDERERIILRARFGLDGQSEMKLEDLGRKLGISRERVRQLQNEALHKLRELLEEELPAAHR